MNIKHFITITNQTFLRMSSFVASLNSVTGKMEWKLQPEDYDYKQEIARSSFGDMLHDTERNEKYYNGIKNSVKYLRERGKEVHVLDIGTGTGLLSMMAVSCGVDSVTACEAFNPMFKCANQVLMDNNMRQKINLIGKRSTEMKVGDDMERKANLLVAEVFDTELIGEGAIETFIHAKENLITEDALVVPMTGTMYAQVIHSPHIKSWNTLNDLQYTFSSGCKNIKIPQNIKNCIGGCLNDIQMSEISSNSFQPLSDPVPVFSFDWTGRNILLKKNESSICSFNAKAEKSCDAVFIWWDINMDVLGKNILSCAPYWAHPNTTGKPNTSSKDIPWRDHWMQAVYFFPNKIDTKLNEKLRIASFHDEYSLWFNLQRSEQKSNVDLPMCSCGLHLSASRSRISQLQDKNRINFFSKIIEENINQNSVCLFLGDMNINALYAAMLGAKHVYITKGEFDEKLVSSIINENNLSHKITMLSDPTSLNISNICSPINFVFSEPYSSHSMLPWHNLHIWYVQSCLRHLLSPDAIILPNVCTMKCIAVDFRDLWKIRSDVGNCCGFDISFFDKLISATSKEVDELVEPHPLWEYPCIALSDPTDVFKFDISSDIPDRALSKTTEIPVNTGDSLNGLALWCEWNFNGKVLTDGPIEDVIVGRKMSWDPNAKQGVFLLGADKIKGNIIKMDTTFDPNTMNFQFNII